MLSAYTIFETNILGFNPVGHTYLKNDSHAVHLQEEELHFHTTDSFNSTHVVTCTDIEMVYKPYMFNCNKRLLALSIVYQSMSSFSSTTTLWKKI